MMRSDWELLMRGLRIDIDALLVGEAAVFEVIKVEDPHGRLHVRWRLPGRPLQAVFDGLQRGPLADRIRMRVAKAQADSAEARA